MMKSILIPYWNSKTFLPLKMPAVDICFSFGGQKGFPVRDAAIKKLGKLIGDFIDVTIAIIKPQSQRAQSFKIPANR